MAFNRRGHAVRPEDEAMIRSVIGPDERIVWHGRPKQGFVHRSADTMFIPFSLIWGGVSILLAFVAFGNRMHPLLLAATGTLALVGLYAIFLRYPLDALIRSRTIYALTTAEAVIVSGVFRKKAVRVGLDGVDAILVSWLADDSGTIVFGPADLGNNPDISGIPCFIRGIRSPKFDMIYDANLVYELVQEAKDALKPQV